MQCLCSFQNKPEYKKLQHGAPEYLDQLEEVFKDAVVDGTTSYIPGQEETYGLDDEEEAAGEEEEQPNNWNSPGTTTSRKRGSDASMRSTASSPEKKSKSPMVHVMKKMASTMSKNELATQEALKNVAAQKAEKRNKLAESITKCQQLALECGVDPSSIEYFACATLFKEESDRVFFCNIPTPEARLVFLKRWCKANNMYQ